MDAVQKKDNWTALAWNGRADVVRVLIQNDADLNVADDQNVTALHFAAEKGHVDVAKVLLQIDARHKRYFCYNDVNGHVDVVKVLIQNGADVNAVDIDKHTHRS